MPGIQFPTTDTGLSDKDYFSEQTCRGSGHHNDTLNDFQETRMKKNAFGVLRKIIRYNTGKEHTCIHCMYIMLINEVQIKLCISA